MEPTSERPIVILGGGVNGAAIARQLTLCGLPVCLLESHDLAAGASSRSSRLIHGGVRYLEYAEFGLVREALHERHRLLRLAPHLVRPLRLFIPVERRWSGVWQAALRFLGRPLRRPLQPRGLFVLRFGLWLYDRFGRDEILPGASVHPIGSPAAPPVAERFRWLCAFDDAQISYPERLVVEMLTDARAIAAEANLSFEVLTHCEPTMSGGQIVVLDRGRNEVRRIRPALIVNATGAWVDDALRRLELSSRRLIGGSKGSHLLTRHAGLRRALDNGGVYAEAEDGRPVFLLPLGEDVLIGTTDAPFELTPAAAVADVEEQQYLCATVNRVFPQVGLQLSDIDWHYSGVRPLPYIDRSEGGSPASTTRRHFLEELPDADPPLVSIIGGKITTCRSLAEETADWVAGRLGVAVAGNNSRGRPFPGGVEYPREDEQLERAQVRDAELTKFSLPQVKAAWRLFGAAAGDVLQRTASIVGEQAVDRLDEEAFWAALARYTVRCEWARRLDDVVERRLMLLYHRPLGESLLRRIAQALVEEDLLKPSQLDGEVEACVERLATHFGKLVRSG